MIETTELCQILAKEPSLEESPVQRYTVKEGTNLPSSITEDVGGFSLCRRYSAEQLRRIQRLNARKHQELQRRAQELAYSKMRRYASKNDKRTILRYSSQEGW